MFSLVGLFIIFAAVIGSTAMMGILAYLLHRIRMVEGKNIGEFAPQGVANQLAVVEEELHLVQEQLSSLTERMDFTEKLLMSGDEETTSE